MAYQNNYFTVTALSAAGESAASNQVSGLPTSDAVASLYAMPPGATDKVYTSSITPWQSDTNRTWYIPGTHGGTTGSPNGWTVAYEGGYFLVHVPSTTPVGQYFVYYADKFVSSSEGPYYTGPAGTFYVTAPRPAAGPGPAYPWQGSSGGVNTGNGNKMTSLAIVGWTARGGMPVEFGITHNSEIGNANVRGELGAKWISSLDVSIVKASSTELDVTWGNGRTYPLVAETATLWAGPGGVNDRITVAADGSYISLTTENDYTYHFVSGGGSLYVPDTITDINGNVVHIYHNGPNGNVSSVVTCPHFMYQLES